MGRAKKVKYSYYGGYKGLTLFLDWGGGGLRENVWYTLDGQTFIEGFDAGGSGTNNSVDYSPTLGRWLIGGINRFVYSNDDGVNWTSVSYRPFAPSTGVWNAIWVTGKGFFAVTNHTGPGNSAAAFSADGITWSAKANPAAKAKYISYSPKLDLFVVGRSTNTQFIDTSNDDMVSWNAVNLGSNGNERHIYWIEFAEIFITWSISTTLYHTSTDGVTWTPRNYPSSIPQNLSWSNNEIVVNFGQAGSFDGVYKSTDGINWNLITVPNASLSNCSPFYCHKADQWYSLGPTVSTSTDAENWTAIQTGMTASFSQGNPGTDKCFAKNY